MKWVGNHAELVKWLENRRPVTRQQIRKPMPVMLSGEQETAETQEKGIAVWQVRRWVARDLAVVAVIQELPA